MECLNCYSDVEEGQNIFRCDICKTDICTNCATLIDGNNVCTECWLSLDRSD